MSVRFNCTSIFLKEYFAHQYYQGYEQYNAFNIFHK